MPRTTLASACSARGELTLQHRDEDDALELRVNGVFVMDTAETTSESALADLAVAGLADVAHGRVLVGGLGLGFTLCGLAGSSVVGEIIVVEIEGALIGWHRRGLVPTTAQIIDDPRLTLVEGDVRGVVASAPLSTLDAIVLDVDNGPGFLVYDDNAAVYQEPFLATCRRALRPGGSLLVWSADSAPRLDDALRRTFGSVAHHTTAVSLGARDESYHTYVATRAPTTGPTCPAR